MIAVIPRALSLHTRPALHLAGLATVLALTFFPDRALAQSESPEQGTTQEEVVITDKARTHFRAGVNFLQDPDGARYEDAHRQFKLAYAESPSWKILGNLGVSAMKLERDGEAIEAFEKYLEGGGDEIPQQEREQFQRDLETLRASVVTVTVTGLPAGSKLVDVRATSSGGNVRNGYDVPADGTLVMLIRPGAHAMTPQHPGMEDQVWKFEPQPASTHEHAFTAAASGPTEGVEGTTTPADSGPTRPVPMYVWVGAGVTGGLLVGGVVTGSLALGKKGKYNDANDSGASDAEDLRKGVKTLNLVTDVLLGSAIVAGAVTTVLYLTRPEKSRSSAFRVDPLLSPQLAGLHLSGQF